KTFCCLILSLVVPAVLYSRTQSETAAARVTIRRDTYGVPHILAKTEEDAAFGLGHAQAEDHAVEIARRLVGARGEEAKYFGQNAEGDFLSRQFDNYETCRKNFTELDPLLQRVFRAYIAGVNHYIAGHRTQLPAWIPVFNEIDVLANIREGALGGVTGVVRRLREKYGVKTAGLREVNVQPGEEWAGEAGSNAFALGPSRTTSGKAILLGNPHLSWSSLYWEAHLTVPGKMNFYGSTLPGFPVLRAGFNEHLGWVTTNNAPDMADVFALKLDPASADHYLFEGKSMPLAKRQATVEIKTADGTLRTESRTFEDSHLGVVIYRTRDQAFVYRSTQLESFRHFEGFYRLAKTRNLDEFTRTLHLGLMNYSNFTYADAAGNIMYFWNAHIPVRVDDGTKYDLDVPADTAKYLWRGLHPLPELPRLLNPRGGYIQNCNDAPWFTSMRDPLSPAKYPAYFENGELRMRSQLIIEMLESQPKYSLNDVMRLKFNDRLLLADRVKPDLIRAIRAAPDAGEDLKKGLAVMEAWDNTTEAASRGGVLFQRFINAYLDAVKKPYAVPWDAANPAKTPSGLSDPAQAVRYFEEAVRWTRTTYGREDIAWGDVHRYRFKGIDLPGDGALGNYGAFRVVGYKQLPDGKRIAGWEGDDKPLAGFGDAWSLAVEFAKPVRAYSVLAYGQTTNSESKHSRDQIGLFAAHQYRKIWFTETEIKTNTEREYHP
ncbi:MAG: penicillin acylase family protein, partial [Blastocatellia bacterium]